VRLAEQADTPALREKLLGLAREWMRAVMDVEDAEARTGKQPIGRRNAPPFLRRRNRFRVSRAFAAAISDERLRGVLSTGCEGPKGSAPVLRR
jgi:hypothetical protein